MSRKKRILLIVTITISIIIVGFGGFLLFMQWPAVWSKEPPVLDFPVANPDAIHIIGGYGMTPWGSFHNGIDFGCNISVNILAPCELRVKDIDTWMYATDPDRWQTVVQFQYNWQYSLSIAFESWANNTTFGDIQRNAIVVKVGQIIPRGTNLGELLYHGDGCHIHFMIKKAGQVLCPYPLFSPSAKVLFDSLWVKYGIGDNICNETALVPNIK